MNAPQHTASPLRQLSCLCRETATRVAADGSVECVECLRPVECPSCYRHTHTAHTCNS